MWFFGDPQARIVRKLSANVAEVHAHAAACALLPADGIKEKTALLRERLANGSPLGDIVPEAFALVQEAAKRSLGMAHYDVQFVGGMVLHQGKIAEMKTGEGKTLVATLPAYLNALSGTGVHIVTVNDYLAQRDAAWMGPLYDTLGLSVGCIAHDAAYLYDSLAQQTAAGEQHTESFKVAHEHLRKVTRKEAYAADITYGTNNEFGFDYLRDNLVARAEDAVQRGHSFAIVDEVDSILIDEARTPLIISMQGEDSTKLYAQFAQIMPHLAEKTHYNIDEKMRAVALNEDGIVKVEKVLGVDNIYDTTIFGGSGIRYLHHLEQALKAKALYQRDKDYIVKDGEVIIVDEFTGRVMPGRRYSEGLHQAIEAKEGVVVQKESRTLASITFQNYFRLYKKLAGMTGTAATSAEEFWKVYKLEVIQIPPNKPNMRQDLPDAIYQSERGKFQAVVAEIKERNAKGQPILVGTASIAKNERLAALLSREGIKHELLNAKNHEREAEIIAQAGKVGAVTIATNMAGRGVDIILGGNPQDPDETQRARELGGLYVLGTERHEARRIDNQLRGRGGRQGDPGTGKFFVSFEDDLMRIFGSDKLKKMMGSFGVPEDQPIENSFVSRAIESAQKKIEGHHFDSRKHVLEYDEVMNKHREVVYKLRREAVHAESVREQVLATVQKQIEAVVAAHTADEYSQNWNIAEIIEDGKTIVPFAPDTESRIHAVYGEELAPEEKREKLTQHLMGVAEAAYAAKEKEFSPEEFNNAAKMVVLRTIDTLWMDHLENMEYMQDSVRLRAYGQQDPLIEYKNEGHKMFKEMMRAFDADVAATIFKIGVHQYTHAAPAQRAVFANASGQPAPAAAASGGGLAKVGRNDPCPCGSGKKYKRCHGK